MPVRQLPIAAFVFATLVATALGCIVQTQVNLAAIVAMGVEVPPWMRLRTTLQDLLGFSRTMAPIAVATLLLALPVATWIARRVGSGRTALCALGAAVGFYVAIPLANAAASMPALIAATRGAPGMAAMALALAAGGAVFGWLTQRSSRRG